MKLKVGDLVRFLNEKGEGAVSKIINKTTVAIAISDDFEIPYLISELVLVNATGKGNVASEEVLLPEQKNESKNKVSYSREERKGIYVAFSPENINDIPNSDINVWLINYTEYKILFTYSILQNSSLETVETDKVDSFETVLIETIDRTLLHDFSSFKIDVLFYKNKAHQHQVPISELVKLKPIKLYKENAFADNSFIPEKSLVMCVSSFNDANEGQTTSKLDFSKMLLKKGGTKNSSQKSKPHANNNPNSEIEIDLHIEELIDNFEGMSNYEIVQVQLNSFKNILDQAVNDHCRKLVVIHGVGNGRLKHEVRNILSKDTNLRFYDASYAKYGFGATEIVIS